MKLTGAAIDRFVKQPDAGIRAVLVYGPDEGLVRERAAAIGRTVVADLSDPFQVASFAHEAPLLEDPTRLADEAASMSLMGGRRLIRVREAGDKLAKAVAGMLESPGDSLAVFEAGDLTPRSALRKLFEAAANAAALPCYVEDEAQLSRTIREQLGNQGIQIDSDALSFLAGNLVGDRMIARQEVEKLITYLGAERSCGLDDILAVIGDSADLAIDDAVTAAAQGDLPALDRTLQRLFAENVAAVALLRQAQSYVRRMHVTKARVDAGESMDVALGRLQPPLFFKVRDSFRRQVDRWTLPRLDQAMERLVTAESQCKTTGSDDVTLAGRAMFAVAQLARAGMRR